MTAEEYRQITTDLLDAYISPIYTIIGAALAFIVIAFAVVLIVRPFIRSV